MMATLGRPTRLPKKSGNLNGQSVSVGVNLTHKTALVAIPPESVWEPIQKIRQQHDSKVRRWMPHITLIYPFCSATEFEGLAGELSTACRRLRPFEVTLREFQTFSHRKGSYTVWLKPEPIEPLLDLHADLWMTVSYDHDFEPRTGRFVPHLSVGQVVDGRNGIGCSRN